MSTYYSCFRDKIEMFVDYRKASGVWNNNYEYNLAAFDKFCANQYPFEKDICQEMIDVWCKRKGRELNRSCNTRNRPIRAFIKFLRKRGMTTVEPPQLLKPEPITYVPHAFTEDELSRFFIECDNIVAENAAQALEKFTCPVLFRLLYSSGIRTTEARFLMRGDVNLLQGVLNIRKSKGYDQHYVALHKSMTDLLIRYDEAVSVLQPNRKFFFESPKGCEYSKEWLTNTFNKLWIKANGTSNKAVPYQLRHHYATTNINSWDGEDGFAFSDKLNYLSKSMGHRHVASTIYYYNISPRLTDILKDKTEPKTNIMIPEMDYEENE